VVLLSGGMDSATCLAIATRDARPVHALTVRYGQRHARELRSARALAEHFSAASHQVLDLPLAPILRSALTDRRRSVPSSGARRRTIPSTYVPARNTILLALALGYAESRRARSIYIGANAIDYSGYPDCRPEFIQAFNDLARRATKAGVERNAAPEVIAPLLRLTKAEVVALGERLEVPWKLTWSCYRGGRHPCGTCDSCRWRSKGFRAARVPDPVT
jgi:7-cyano-7-deazaguanine synthase